MEFRAAGGTLPRRRVNFTTTFRTVNWWRPRRLNRSSWKQDHRIQFNRVGMWPAHQPPKTTGFGIPGPQLRGDGGTLAIGFER
jgi:hypothetical protein